MGSTRLPGKVLLPLNGHTVLEEVIARCRRIAGVDDVVCAIPHRYNTTRLLRVAWRACGVENVFTGPEEDVLERYVIAARGSEADIIVRITADCPLISPELCGRVLHELFRQIPSDYASNVTEPRTFPQGYDCEVFTRELLERAHQEAGPDEREHVTTWMRSDPSVKRTFLYAPWRMEGRLTLDTEDDYKTICAYFGHAPYEHLRAA